MLIWVQGFEAYTFSSNSGNLKLNPSVPFDNLPADIASRINNSVSKGVWLQEAKIALPTKYDLPNNKNIVLDRGDMFINEEAIEYAKFSKSNLLPVEKGTIENWRFSIDELKANKPTEYKRWRACDDQLYFKIDNLGDVEEIVEIGYSSDDYRYNTGNYFKTEKEAEQHKAYLLALQTIKDDVEGFAPDWENSHEKKWFGYYDH